MQQLPLAIEQRATATLPSAVLALLTKYSGQVWVAGGFLRAIAAGEKPSDCDLFVQSSDVARILTRELVEDHGHVLVADTGRATTFRGSSLAIQIITAWTFHTPEDAIRSFDFTICGAALWTDRDGRACSVALPTFLESVKKRQLVYTYPTRFEAPGGSLVRLFKFYGRGYAFNPETLAAVITRALHGAGFGVSKPRWHEAGETHENLVMAISGACHRLPRPPGRVRCPSGDATLEEGGPSGTHTSTY